MQMSWVGTPLRSTMGQGVTPGSQSSTSGHGQSETQVRLAYQVTCGWPPPPYVCRSPQQTWPGAHWLGTWHSMRVSNPAFAAAWVMHPSLSGEPITHWPCGAPLSW